ncbi:MAG: asparagine synthase (glutamine-hydrolyzing) [Candidimonas sp.]|nr:asparagine synthase (glutamine-hydrolyzing) [Candidimonas sp.]
MCGIAGILSFRENGNVTNAQLESMRDAMVHRGPDGAGVWIDGPARVGLAHRRLSIIDLSQSAAQPMCNEDETVWLTFNGEIYNHSVLRNELIQAGHRFRTDHSDTEVLVHGYEQWGVDGLLQRIAGDYAFAIWNGAKKKLYIARDRVGVKPLYFAWHEGLFLFGSEIKAILGYPGFPRDVSAHALYHYLSFMTTPAPLTMFDGVFKLPAGHYLELDLHGGVRAERYWDAVPGKGIDPRDIGGLSDRALEDFYVGGIRSRLEDAVGKRMMSDVPFGVFLSGGVDSSANVAMMSRLMDRPVDSFTVGFKDFPHLNELEYAQQIATKYKTNHHEILIDEKDMVGYLESLIHHQDEPLADWVCIPLHFLSKLAHDSGVTVVQVGEGSDEQFAGYASYMGYLRLYHRYWQPFREYIPSILQRGIAAGAQAAANYKPELAVYADIIDRAARNREHFWSGATVFWDTLKRPLINQGANWATQIPQPLLDSGLLPPDYLETDSFNVIQSFLSPFDKQYPKSDALTRMIYNEFKLRLPELLLMRVDKITMSHSLEARVPFLDHDLVDFTMDIPEGWKTKNGEAKYLLKKAVEGLLPDNVIYRKKMGFGAPMADWLRGDFGRQAESAVLGSRLLDRGFLNVDHIAALFRAHRDGRRDNSLYCWTLFNLTSWYDYWVDR